MSAAQLTVQHRMQFNRAVGNDKIGNDILDKIDGISNPGTLNLSAPYATIDEQVQTHLTTITLVNQAVTMVDGGANGAIGNKKIYTFPAGLIKIHAARTNLTVSSSGTAGIATGGTLKHSVGTIPAATNDTLSLTKANVIPSTSTVLSSYTGSPKGKSLATAIAALTDNTGGTPSDTLAVQTGSYVQATIQNSISSLASKINELIAAGVLNGSPVAAILDGTSAAVALYLNFGVANADSASDDVLTVSGTVQFSWSFGGN